MYVLLGLYVIDQPKLAHKYVVEDKLSKHDFWGFYGQICDLCTSIQPPRAMITMQWLSCWKVNLLLSVS